MAAENMIFTITESEQGCRLDKYLSERMENYSRSYIQRLIDDEHVFINQSIKKSNYKLRPFDVVQIFVPEPEVLNVAAEEIPLDIIYEDEDILIVNKPKGMVVHPAAGHSSGTLVNAVMFHCQDHLSTINGVMRPGIVHRIDKDTSGVLIVCKNDMAHQCVAGQLAVHSITRKYRAIVHGVLADDEGTIHAEIGRHPEERKKMAVHVKNGRDAVTHYKVLSRLRGYTYIECTLETGRTHQIRVHMASIGHPILGDIVYGPKKCPIKGLQGQTLHAMVLGLIHPSSGEYVEFQADLPRYFQELLKKLK